MQSKVIDVPLSSNDVYDITENGVWNRLGFNPSISFYPVFNNVTNSLSRMVYRSFLNDIRRKLSKDGM